MTNLSPHDWSNSGVDLLLESRSESSGGLRTRLEAGLRDAIRSGRLARGVRLPPTRALARDLGVSRGTVLEAYAQLSAEGWLSGRQGSGTVVAFDAERANATTRLREPPPTRWRCRRRSMRCCCRR